MQGSNAVDVLKGHFFNVHSLQVIQLVHFRCIQSKVVELVEAMAVILEHLMGHVLSEGVISDQNDPLEVLLQILEEVT